MADEDVDAHVLRKYNLVQKLGKGAYGVVYKAVDRKTQQLVALKKIFDAFQNATDAQARAHVVLHMTQEMPRNAARFDSADDGRAFCTYLVNAPSLQPPHTAAAALPLTPSCRRDTHSAHFVRSCSCKI